MADFSNWHLKPFDWKVCRIKTTQVPPEVPLGDVLNKLLVKQGTFVPPATPILLLKQNSLYKAENQNSCNM